MPRGRHDAIVALAVNGGDVELTLAALAVTALAEGVLECVRASAGGALLMGDFGGVHCFDFVDPSARA